MIVTIIAAAAWGFIIHSSVFVLCMLKCTTTPRPWFAEGPTGI